MASAPSRSPYFVNVWVDVLAIGGLSLVGATLYWGLDQGGHPDPFPGLAWALAWIVNWPHFSASSYRLYHSRANLLQYPLTALGIPVLVVLAMVGAYRAPETVGAALVKLYFLWSPFHFTGQSLGISLLYARRAGTPMGRLPRGVLSGFLWASYLNLIIGQEVGTQPVFLKGIGFPLLSLPPWMATAATWASDALGILLVLTVAMARDGAGRRLPWVVLLPAGAQYVWFVAGTRLEGFQALVPFFHALQYLLIALAMQLRERLAAGGARPSGGFVARESFRWGALNVLGGAILFWALPLLASRAGAHDAVAAPILFVGVQIHHFFVDGVIWKLRDSRVGSPLGVSLAELSGAALPAAGGRA